MNKCSNDEIRAEARNKLDKRLKLNGFYKSLKMKNKNRNKQSRKRKNQPVAAELYQRQL